VIIPDLSHCPTHRDAASPLRPCRYSASSGYRQYVRDSGVDPAALRRCVLAVSVLDDVDVEPRPDGFLVLGRPGVERTSGPNPPAVLVTWAELRQAVGADPETELARARLSRWLRTCVAVAAVTGAELADRARPVGLPRAHELHPGDDWVQHRVLGGALDLGFGFVGLLGSPDVVDLVPQPVLDRFGVDPAPWWPAAEDYLERMGAVAAERLRRDPKAPLRPIGDCDVVTLLGSRNLRSAVCAGDGTGLRAVAVPMRRRGWTDLSRIDPAFALAAAAATSAEERGFARPLLLTREEVALAPSGGDPARIVLRDRAASLEHWRRDALYR